MMYAIVFCAGLLAGALAFYLPLRRERQLAARLRAEQAELVAASALQAQAGLVESGYKAEYETAQERVQEMEQRVASMREQFSSLQSVLQNVRDAHGGALDQAGELASAITDLQDAEIVFDRWHTDMTRLLDHNRHMHAKNDDFSQIVRQMVIVGLNASIEAAHAGSTGRGFNVVATEMRELSARAEALSADYRKALYENDLITTTTFQDMQASGRMIIGAVRALEFNNRKSMDLLAAPAATA